MNVKTDLEQATLRRAYMELLRLPHGALRLRLQVVLATLCDEIAMAAGRTSEEIQNAYEAFVASEQK